MRRMVSPVKFMKDSGRWAQLWKKTYQHVDGATISYDCMAWRWLINGKGNFTTLWEAVFEIDPLIIAAMES